MASFPGQKGTGSPLPSPPLNLAAGSPTASSIPLSWSPPIGGAISYNVYRNAALIASNVTALTYTDTALTGNTTYTYYVTAVNALGEGLASNPVSPRTLPAAPTSLHSTATTTTTATLAWTAPAGGTSTYNLYRNGVKVATGITATSTVDTGLSPATTYSYGVTGQNASGEGPISNTATATTANSSGTTTRVHGGHRFWFNNPFWTSGSNQRNDLIAALPTLGNVNNLVNGVKIVLTPANISDATLTGGKQTFNTFRTNLQDILNLVKGQTAKKLYITIENWNQAFYRTFFGTVQSVSGNTITSTTTISPSTGWQQCGVGGRYLSVVSSTSTTVTLSAAPGVSAGASFALNAGRANDSSFWPTWLINENPGWVKVFIQSNGNGRGQLDYDNPNVWAFLTEMHQNVMQIIDQLDTDDRIDIYQTQDESVAASVDSNGNTVMNNANYDAKFQQMHLDIAPSQYSTNRMIWCPLQYLGSDSSIVSCYNATTTQFPSKFGFGGPDPPLFGVHGSPTLWYTNFLNLIAGVTPGFGGDIRDSVFRIGDVQGAGLGGGSNFSTCPPPIGSAQAFWNDAITRNAVPAVGSRPAHTGMGSQVFHWNWQQTCCLKSADELAVINANNGFFCPFPPGNWDTTP